MKTNLELKTSRKMPNLFKDVDDLRSIFPQIHASADDMMTYVSTAEEVYIVPFISQAFYDELLAALDAANYVLSSLTAAQQSVLKPLRQASAYYGIYKATPYLNMQVSDVGAMEHVSGEASGIRQWMFNMAQGSSIQDADLFMDKALSIMEATPGNYTTWGSSAAFTSFKKYFLTNADDFNSKGLVDIAGSRRTFLRLVPFIAKTELQYIIPCIGDTLFDAIKAKLLAGTALSSYEASLLDKYIYPALAHYTIYIGSPNLNLDISSNGLRVVSTQDGIKGKKLHEKAYTEWRMQMLGDAKNYLARAKKYLDDNAENITEYQNDDAAKNETPDYKIPDNSGSKSSVML
jgi:hypothetical protein